MVGTPKSEALFLCFRADDDDDDATSIRKAGGRITLDTLFEKSPLDHSFAYAAGETRWRMQINWRITVACRRKAPQFQANTVRMRPFAVKFAGTKTLVAPHAALTTAAPRAAPEPLTPIPTPSRPGTHQVVTLGGSPASRTRRARPDSHSRRCSSSRQYRPTSRYRRRYIGRTG